MEWNQYMRIMCMNTHAYSQKIDTRPLLVRSVVPLVLVGARPCTRAALRRRGKSDRPTYAISFKSISEDTNAIIFVI